MPSLRGALVPMLVFATTCLFLACMPGGCTGLWAGAPRKFLQLPRSPNAPSSEDAVGTAMLRVLQYNVLADGLAGLRDDGGGFSRATKGQLNWETRKHKLLSEITRYSPDVITLQEVDHYYDFFLPELRQRGYVGIFGPKPTSACLEVSDSSDGCAMFINSKRLRVLSCETQTLALSKAELTDSGELQEDEKNIRAQNQVALIAVCVLIDADEGSLSSNSTARSRVAPPPIVVGTTHLKSSKSATGERYRQLGINNVLSAIGIIYKNLERVGRTPAVVLTGCLNAVPNTVQYEPLCYRAVKAHSLGLRSVYNEDLSLSQVKMSVPQVYTTWKKRVSDGGEVEVQSCVDYIFYRPYQPRTIRESTGKEETGVVAYSSSQVALSLMLRFTVYFFGALIPLTSLLSTQLTDYERFGLLGISVLFILLFEVSSGGSIFRPQLNEQVRPEMQPADAAAKLAGIKPSKKDRNRENKEKDRNRDRDKDRDWDRVGSEGNYRFLRGVNGVSYEGRATIAAQEAALLGRRSVGALKESLQKSAQSTEASFLKSVASLSQQLQPLQQFGNPGFLAHTALDLFTEEQVGEARLPSAQHPSDHIVICTDLRLVWSQSEGETAGGGWGGDEGGRPARSDP
ncbi:Endonuclease/exonuclease/phosphatase [Ochromonadaceae sp. CCMP2298]|nr:Endonuclease/exonuclease/phosphatase [Ochromonadaceae sp. CCMP2298]